MNVNLANLDDIKTVELEIFNVVKGILDKYRIPYFVAFGSCIGAIRHKGFIPWDDDIDICLYREHYEKARVIFQKELPLNFLYMDNRTESQYPYNFGKVKKKNTAFVHGGDAHLDIHHGIYIDLFPLDNCFADRQQTERMMKKIERLRHIVDLCSMSYQKYGRLRPLWQLPIIFFVKHLYNKSKIQTRIDELCMQVKETSSEVCCYLTPYGVKDIYKKEWFGEGKETQFESITCLVPAMSNEYLSHIYGDYMKLPPIEKRVSHHDVVFSSISEEYHPKQ